MSGYNFFNIQNFIDGGQPPWDYLLKFIFYNTNKKNITINLSDEKIVYKIDTLEEKYESMDDFRSKCKRLSDFELEKALVKFIC